MLNGYREFTLDNGLRVVLQDFPSRNILGKLRVNMGAFHEKPGEEGLAHFVEHGISSGGSRQFSPNEADGKLDDLIFWRHDTSLGRTNYVYLLPGDEIEDWMNFISDIIFFPKFDDCAVESERRAIIRELIDDKSRPSYDRRRRFFELFYGDHPKKLDVGGKESVVIAATVDDLRRIHTRGYNANSSDLILIGNLPGNIEDLIHNSFNEIPLGGDMRVDFPKMKPLEDRKVLHFSSPEDLNLDSPNESSADVRLNFQAPSTGTQESYAFNFLDWSLGRGTMSRLFRRLRVEEGLAYGVSSSYDGNYNAGIFRIRTQVPAKRIEDAVRIIAEEIDRTKQEGISQEWLEKLKRKFRLGLNCSFDSNGGVLNMVEYKLDYGINTDEGLTRSDAVTSDDVRDVANKYLIDRCIVYIEDPLKNNGE